MGKNKMTGRNYGIMVLVVMSLLFSTLSFGATSIELTTGSFINVFGNLNLSGNNLVNAGNVSIKGNLSVDGNFSVDGNTLFVDATGDRVGIGTTSPLDRLHINGDILVNDTSNDARLRLFGSGSGKEWVVGAGGSGGSANGDLYIQHAGIVTAITIQNTSGNVGIGITSPTEKLQVHGNIHIRHEGDQILRFTEANKAARWAIGVPATGSGAQTGADLVFRGNGAINLTAPEGTEYMRITSAGKIGIGTTAPAEKLQVNGNLVVNATLYGDSSIGRLDLLGDLGASSGLSVKDDGNVGIGTTTPVKKFEVVGNATITGELNISGTDNNNMDLSVFDTTFNSQLEISYGTTGRNAMLITSRKQNADRAMAQFRDTVNSYNWYTGLAASSGNVYSIGTGNDFNDVPNNIFFAITSGGNVGINTTSPGAKLTVVGDASITTPVDGNAPALTITRENSFNVDAAEARGDTIRIRNTNTGTNIASGISIRDASSNNFGAGIFFIQTGQSAGAETFETSFWTTSSGNGGAGERMKIASDGTVTINGTLQKGTTAYTNPDIAEKIPSTQLLEEGDLVVADETLDNHVL
ncbi:hypothetical protein HYT53_02085, partial [Candidatus Woesearchaeota archaeon]|nr:hypothetical protein [Candidatus Woesearchaeota archaeon]